MSSDKYILAGINKLTHLCSHAHNTHVINKGIPKLHVYIYMYMHLHISNIFYVSLGMHPILYNIPHKQQNEYNYDIHIMPSKYCVH